MEWTSDQQVALVRLPAAALSGSDPGQFVHTHVPLRPGSIIWHRQMSDDTLRLSKVKLSVGLASLRLCVIENRGLSTYGLTSDD